VIVTLGRYSLGTFFPGVTISRIHGAIREVNGRFFFPMYHPAAALRQERYRQAIIEDMRGLGVWLRAYREAKELRESAASPVQVREQLSLF
jgi:DNA polymerase